MNVLQEIKALGQPAEAYRVTLTPELAQHALDVMAHNRPVRPSRVGYYASLIENGEWAYTGQGLIVSTEGKLIDGQHRCLAVVQTGIPVEVLVVTGVTPENWRRMDQGSARASSDMIEVPFRTAVASALSLIFREQRGWRLLGYKQGSSRLTPPDAPIMLAQFQDVIPAALWASDHSGSRGIRMPAGTLTYCLFRARMHDHIKADVFVDQLYNGLGLTETSPVHLLRERLIANAISKTKLPPKDVLAMWIKAWIAFDAGRPMSQLKWTRRKSKNGSEKFPTWPGPALPGTITQTSVEDDVEVAEEEIAHVAAQSHEQASAAAG